VCVVATKRRRVGCSLLSFPRGLVRGHHTHCIASNA
jgi:hypothetical protein